MTSNPRQDPEIERTDELVPADDQIIGRALRASAWAALALAVVGLAIWLATREAPVEPEVVAATPDPAQSLKSAVSEPPQLPFKDITQAAGVAFAHTSGAYGERLLPETMGGGVALFDFDNDLDLDLLLVDSARWPWFEEGPIGGVPLLYRNRGDGTFDDVTAATGLDQVSLYGMGVAVGDFDADGFRDVYLTAVGRNRLLRNIDGETFVDVTTERMPVDDEAWSTSAAFFDADNDGDLDLFVCNYVRWSREIDQVVDYRLTGIGRAYGPPTNYEGTFSRLYRNDDGRFTDISSEAGIEATNSATGAPAGKALAVLPIDVDLDGLLDLVIANDTVGNFLFRNLGGARFEEIGTASGLAFDNTGRATGAMGLDVAADEQGGQLAIAIGNFANEMTSFYVAPQGELGFSDQAIVSGIGPGSRQALSFGLFFFDADLDGRLDLLQTNGHVEDEINVVQPSQNYEQPTQLFWQCGADCARRFVQIEAAALGDLGRPVVGRGATYGDLDGDGDLDVVLTQIGRAPLILRNEQALGHHALTIRLGTSGLNRDAIGARVRVEVGGEYQVRWVMPARSYLSQVPLAVTFGLGDHDTVDEVVVFWPDGGQSSVQDVAADQLLLIER